MENFLTKTSQTVLLIGYGNDLRGDDAVGKRVADAVAAWKLAGVVTLAVHQLTPELAATLAKFERAIFVDAYITTDDKEVGVHPLEPAHTGEIAGHTGDPQSLLALTQALYEHCPQAWWVTVPGVNFGVGDSLSLIAEQGVAKALERIEQLLKETALSSNEAISHARSRIDAPYPGPCSRTGTSAGSATD
jgi:hydrogenase maturation protease